MEEEDDKRSEGRMEIETDDEMCVNEKEDCNSSGETVIVSDSENKEKETMSQSDSYENISTHNEKEMSYTKKMPKIIEKQPTNFKPKPVRSLSSQSASTTISSTLVGTQNGKKMSSASASAQDFTNSEPVRLTGYLEKRSKMLGWKKFWCVLDGRLLTYYKSKSEYESLSACCGSINLGIASTVRPIQIRGCKGFPLQIVTRTQVYYLRSLDKATSDHWLIAIQEAASSSPKISYPVWTDPGKQFFRYSFAALSQWSLNTSSDDITSTLNHMPQNFYLKNDRPHPLMQKCHSFTSLQSPVVNCIDKMSSRDDSGNTENGNSFLRRSVKKSNSNSIETVTNGKVRHSTSMIALESSPQAGDLKRELSRKLSVGSTMAEKADILIESSNLKKNKDNEIDKDAEEDNGSHHYDEILDFEGTTYEPCGQEENHGDNDIYEQVETVDDPWEKLDKKIDLKMEKRSNGGLGVRGCPNRNSLVSISEAPEDVHNGKKNLETIQEHRSQWKNVSFKRHNSDEDSSNCSSNLSVNTSDKSGKKWKSIGGFFQKMFHKEKGKKAKEKNSPMVISGPVDIRNLVPSHEKEKEKEKPKKGQAPAIPTNVPAKSTKAPHPPGSQMAINNENVMEELKKKVSNLKKVDSQSDGSNSDLSSRSNSVTMPTLERKSSVNSEEIKNHPILRKKNSNDSISSNVSEANASAYMTELVSTLTRKKKEKEMKSDPVEKEADDTVPISRESKEFQLKLARFNRLSQKLSTSFAAVLNPIPANPTFGYIGRSRSCRFQNKQDETLPPLPPKKKNNTEKQVPIYDVPPNNRPVSKEHLLLQDDILQGNGSTEKNFHKALTKKNSAPEIIFSISSMSSRTSGESVNFLRNSLDEVVFDDSPVPTIAPPRPPKGSMKTLADEQKESADLGNIALGSEKAADLGNVALGSEKATDLGNAASGTKESGDLKESSIEQKPSPTVTTEVEENLNTPETVTNSEKSCILPQLDEISSMMSKDTEEVVKGAETTDVQEMVTSCDGVVAEPSEDLVLEMDHSISVNEENVQTTPSKTDENEKPKSIIEELQSKESQSLEKPKNFSERPFEPVTGKISEEKDDRKEEVSETVVENGNKPIENPDLLTVDIKLSPTASNKSVDIDSLEILSDISDLNDDSSPPPDSPPPVPYQDVQMDIFPLFRTEKSETETKTLEKDANEDVGVSIEEIPEEETTGEKPDENEHIYENIKFATIQTIVQELETVEENEDEMSELYDDFPFEFSTPSPQFKYGPSPVDSLQPSLFVNDKPRGDLIHHSGIDQLQAFLNSDVSNLSNESMTDDFDFNEESNDMMSVFPPPPPIFRTGAVSRLGHSSAINQLQRIAENNN